MTEIPEHLLKRAQAAREKAAAEAGAPAEAEASGDSRIPAHLLERSKAAKAGGSSVLKAVMRITFWGTVAMGLTALTGSLFNVVIG